MPYNPDQHHRRSPRLRTYDYASAGAYFITLCAAGRECVFGEVAAGEMRLSTMGEIADLCWQAIPDHFSAVTLDDWIVMPNHIHGIIVIEGHPAEAQVVVGTQHAASPPASLSQQPIRTDRDSTGTHRVFGGLVAGSLPTIVRSYKSAVTKQINDLRETRGVIVWQERYYEHVVRNNADLARIQEYIVHNPGCWAEDRENPANWQPNRGT